MSTATLRSLGLVVLLAVVLGACSGSDRPAAQHAAPSVAPGSHEDWCEEHQVPETQCTRCDPSLSAAFQATGDWCAEHGLPESQCKRCNPALEIERPAKKGG